jgi:hypothetical protein
MRTCSQRTICKVEYGSEVTTNLKHVHPEMRPDALYNPKEKLEKKKAPKKLKALTCDYCDDVNITDKISHKCYMIEKKVRSKFKAEIKHEIKTEGTRSLGFVNDPTYSTIPVGSKVCIEVIDSEDSVEYNKRRRTKPIV